MLFKTLIAAAVLVLFHGFFESSGAKAQTTTRAYVCRHGHNIEHSELLSFHNGRLVKGYRFANNQTAASMAQTQNDALARLDEFPDLQEKIIQSLSIVRSQWNGSDLNSRLGRPSAASSIQCSIEPLVRSHSSTGRSLALNRMVYLTLSHEDQAAAEVEHALHLLLHNESLSQSLATLLFVSPTHENELNETALIADRLLTDSGP